jgi:uncharacterized protein YbbC (DUF1343 family)
VLEQALLEEDTSAVHALAGPTMNLRFLLQRAAIAASFLLAFTWSARAAISLGIDELEKSNFSLLQGKRVGLVTNPSGVDSHGRSAIDALYNGQGAGYHLVKLFGPEHGIDGQTKAGDPVANSRDHKNAPAGLFPFHHAGRKLPPSHARNVRGARRYRL